MKKLYEDLQKRDIDAFNKFVDDYSELILKVIHSSFRESYLKDFVLECYNDTLFTIWNKIHLYDSSYKFEAWIISIAKNKSIDYLRRLSKQKDNECELIEELNEKSRENIEELLLRKEEYKDIMKKVDNMDLISKNIFISKFILDKDIGEISNIVGISEGAIYKRINRMKEKLRGGR